MANNPFDPPIVQVKKTLNRGGLGTVNRGYGSLKSSTRKVRQAPPAEQPEWWPENLSELGDVDTVTVPPTFGQTLVWNGTQWVPGSGGGGGGSTAGCSIYRNASWSAPTTGTNVQAQIPFDSLAVDDTSGSMWDSGSPSQIEIPFEGWWRLEANLQYSNGISSYARIQIRVNGFTVAEVAGDVDGTYMTQHVDRTVKLSGGDIVTAWYEKRGGGGGTQVGASWIYLQAISM